MYGVGRSTDSSRSSIFSGVTLTALAFSCFLLLARNTDLAAGCFGGRAEKKKMDSACLLMVRFVRSFPCMGADPEKLPSRPLFM